MDGHPHPHAHKTLAPVSVANPMLVEIVPAPWWNAVISGPSLQSSSKHSSGASATDVISAADTDDLVKGGEKGVYVGILLALGLGVALKIDDGARRADDIDASPVADSNQLGRS